MLDEDAKWFRVSLRLMGDGVEKLLGLSPTNLRIKGQIRFGKDGREYGPNTTNLWSHSLNVSPEIGFEDQIQSLFESLGDRVENLRKLALTEGVEAELFCGFGSGNGQGGDIILPGTLKLVGDTGLSLSLDLYPPSVDEWLEPPGESEG